MTCSMGKKLASPVAPLSPPPRAVLRAFLKSNYSAISDLVNRDLQQTHVNITGFDETLNEEGDGDGSCYYQDEIPKSGPQIRLFLGI